MVFKSKLSGRAIKSQSREIISKVIDFMNQEARGNQVTIPLKNVLDRVAAATGISKSSIKRINNEKKKIATGECSKFSSPRRKILAKSNVTDICDFNKGVLKRIILNTFTTEPIVPTIRTIHKKFDEAVGFNGCCESLRKIVKRIGFRWIKTKTNRKLLMERHEIKKLRVNYLRAIKSYRAEVRPIVFVDETYIHAAHTKTHVWSNSTNEGLLKPISKGQRLIIVHAGSEEGFVPNASLMFKSNTKSGDYHDEMNFENFQKWLVEKLIPNLPARSVVVIDNAPYHNVQKDKAPNFNSRKNVMLEWLRERGIHVDNAMLKTELYELIKINKPRFKRFVIDDLFSKHGHNVLRLPPYHPDLNPIELVWASLKQYVAEKNTTFKIDDVIGHCDTFLNSFSAEEWRSRCQHAKKCEQEFLIREGNIDNVIDSFLINLNDDESDETDSDGSSQSDDNLSGIEELSS